MSYALKSIKWIIIFVNLGLPCLEALKYSKYQPPGEYNVKLYSSMFTDPLVILSFNIQDDIEHVCVAYKYLKVIWAIDKWLHSGSLSLVIIYSENNYYVRK